MLLGHKQRRAFGDVLTRELSLQSASLGSASKLCPAGHSKLSPMPVKLNGNKRICLLVSSNTDIMTNFYTVIRNIVQLEIRYSGQFHPR